MKIPCIRCGELIESPKKGNAKYIKNDFDVKTHGPREKTEYHIKKNNGKLKTFKKFKDAKKEFDKEKEKANNKVKNKKQEVDDLVAELEAIPQTPENAADRATKAAILNSRIDELRAERDEDQSIVVEAEDVVENVPKTGIICLKEECQDQDDLIIWG